MLYTTERQHADPPSRLQAFAMPVAYRYTAIRSDGTREDGELTASSVGEARAALQATGLFPIALHERRRRFIRPTAPSIESCAVGLRMLATLLDSKLAMDRVLEAFEVVAPDDWRHGNVARLRAAVREGRPFGAALRSADLSLPTHILGLIEAGDAAGALPASLRQAATLLEDSARHRREIRGALAYPTVLALSGSVAVALLAGVVLPRFSGLLLEVGQELPTSAALLLQIVAALRAFAPLAIGLTAVLGILCLVVVRSNEQMRRALYDALLRVPVVGPIRHASASARSSAALSGLLSAGVPIAIGLLHVAEAAGDPSVRARLLAARGQVVRGVSLSAAFAATRAVRTSTMQLVRAGEMAGELVEMLRLAAQVEHEWSSRRLQAVVRLVEPTLILCFGAIVAFVAAALLQSVYAIRPI